MNTVAVVVTTFNHAQYLDESLRSIYAQTITPEQVIVVDDGSTDDPAAVVLQYPNALLIRMENRGLSAARNKGLGAVQTDYVVFLDADDRLRPGAIAFGLEAHRVKPGVSFVYGAHRRIDGEGNPIGRINYQPVLAEPFGGLLRGNRIGMHGSVMYATKAIKKVVGFDETLARCEDYEIFLRIAGTEPIASHPRLVADYRIHDFNMSKNHGAMLATALKVQNRYRGKLKGVGAAEREGRQMWRAYYGEQALRSANGIAGFVSALRVAPGWAMHHLFRTLGKRMMGLARRAAFDAGRLRSSRTSPSPPVGSVRWGDFDGCAPVSRDFGWDRGNPIDRFYIEDFLGRNSDAIANRVLEVGSNTYSKRFGAERVTHQDVLHVNADGLGATIIGDISNPATLVGRSFDCIIFTQTLHLIFDMDAAIEQLFSALRPGGVLLLTTPGISPVDRGEWANSWLWSLTPTALSRLMLAHFDKALLKIEAHGNVFAATAFLQGLCCEEVNLSRLLHRDAAYPVIVAARASRRK